ncbi:MAG: sugar transferase [Desulfitobacteriaceae bacterium]
MNQCNVASEHTELEGEGKEITSKCWRRVVKRLLDLLVAVILLVVLAPLWLLIFIGIRVDSPGTALFRQTRVGLGGKTYKVFKFRTMIPNADFLMQTKLAELQEIDDFVFQVKDDPRITRSGKILRKTSLDELPQLLNILIGNMSLVGPRPEVPEIVKLYTPEQAQRLSVPPGVTGLAQINGRSELTLGETIAYDLEYIQKWSLGLDLKILWNTLFVVLTGKGAY